jgi:TonB family protein
MGGLGTKGLGTGGGGGYGTLDLGNRTKESTRIIPGKTIVVGGLSKDVIARVIRSHQHEIKYCYEVELQKNPSLSGKVAVMFTIDATGAVSENKISDTSLHNGGTEQCMLARIQRWRFPEPEGGGEVNVTFPWFFKPAGVDAKSEQG